MKSKLYLSNDLRVSYAVEYAISNSWLTLRSAAWHEWGVSPKPHSKRQRAPVDVFRYRDYREFLAAFYAAKKPAGLSFRGFARAAGLGAPNYLKLVIDGKRNLSSEMALRFAKACRLNAEATAYFQTLVAFNQAKTDEERNELHERLSAFPRFRAAQRLELAEKEYHSSWYIPAVRELVACDEFQEDSDWIAGAMLPPITPKQAAQAIEVLLRLRLVERDAKGRLRQASRAVTTGKQTAGLYIRNYHTEMMQRATQAMHDVPAAERYISALTLSASPNVVDEVMRRVIEFRAELAALCDGDPEPSRVVQLNLQLFPLSRELSSPQTGTPTGASASPPSVRNRSKKS